MGVTAAIAGVAIAAGGTTYSVIQSNKQEKEAENAASQQAQDEQTLQQQALDQQKSQASNAALAQTEQAALNKQKIAAASAEGAGSTILTSPMGVQSNPNTGQGQKTLLGM